MRFCLAICNICLRNYLPVNRNFDIKWVLNPLFLYWTLDIYYSIHNQTWTWIAIKTVKPNPLSHQTINVILCLYCVFCTVLSNLYIYLFVCCRNNVSNMFFFIFFVLLLYIHTTAQGCLLSVIYTQSKKKNITLLLCVTMMMIILWDACEGCVCVPTCNWCIIT